MSPDGPSLVYLLIALVFVASSLFGMRMNVGQAVKMLLAWVAIFAVGFAVFAYRSELSSIGQRLRAEATGEPITESSTIRIPVAEDGHFWVTGKVNGLGVRFMVDSGASVTTITRDTARAAGLELSDRTMVVRTASGRATVIRGRAESLEIGPIRRTQFGIDVIDQSDVNLLGMNFLASLDGWGVEGNYLVLRARDGSPDL